MRDAGTVAHDRNRTGSGRPPADHLRDHRLHLSLSRRARLISTIFLVAAMALIPWTILLGLTLPPKYDAGHWNLLWAGFDVGLLFVLGYAAWAAWFRGGLPLAVFFFWLYRRIVLNTIAVFHQLLGDGPPPRRLRDARIFRPSNRPPASGGDRVTPPLHDRREPC